MSLEPLELPVDFDWQNVKSAIEEWTFVLTQSQRFVPTGAMYEFGGSVAPDGYVECDGAEYEQTKYPDLFAVIGQTYGGNPGTFNVPTGVAAVGQIWIIKV